MICITLGHRCGWQSSFVAQFFTFHWFLLFFTRSFAIIMRVVTCWFRLLCWNSLPDLVTTTLSVAVFRSRLKTHLFNISYPCDCTVPVQWLVAFDTTIVLTCLPDDLALTTAATDGFRRLRSRPHVLTVKPCSVNQSAQKTKMQNLGAGSSALKLVADNSMVDGVDPCGLRSIVE